MVVRVRSRFRSAVASRIPTCPPHALPTQSTGSVSPSPSRACSATATHSANVKSRRTASLLPCDGPSIAYTVRCRPRFPISGSQDRESTNRLCHNTTGGPAPVRRTCSRPRSVLTECGAGVIMAMLPITSDSETSVAVGSSVAMATSRPLPPDRLAIGQVLVRLLLEVRADLAGPRAKRGYSDVRDPHLPRRRGPAARTRGPCTVELGRNLGTGQRSGGTGLSHPAPRPGRRPRQARPSSARRCRRYRRPVGDSGRREGLRPDVPHRAASARPARPAGSPTLTHQWACL